jgi:uncharacterized membrane protein
MTKIKIIILLLLSVLTFYRLLRPGYFSMQDDMHIFRLQQFDRCLDDGQVPCRYIPDGGLGYGYPLFNYYSPLPYALGETFHLIGFSFIDSIKIVFILGHLLAPIGMFFLANLFFGPNGGFIAAVIFMFAPYQSTDSYVRGSIAEFLALNLIPLSLYFVLRNSQKSTKISFLWATLSLTALFLSHNLFAATSLFVFILIIAIFNPKNLVKSFIPIFVSILLSAFFLIPAAFEKNLVHVDTMTQGYFYYVNHFATLNELFISRFWGYGASLWGPIDDMSFQIGWIQWIVPSLIFIFVFFQKNLKHKTVLCLFMALAVFFIFLTHNQSTFIWKNLFFMPYFQFPWRFVGFATIFLSLISGSIFLILKNSRFSILLLISITIITIGLNFNYFKEDIWYPSLTDSQKLSGQNLIAQQGAGLKDYWPTSASNFPTISAPSTPWSDQKFDLISYSKKSNRLNLTVNTTSPQTVINLPLVFFPTWQLILDGQKSSYQVDPKLGIIQVTLSPGKHDLSLTFHNTPLRSISNIISLLTLVVILGYLYGKKH